MKQLKEKGYPTRILVRKTERGLSSAVLDGFSRAKAKYLLCMDADLQVPSLLFPPSPPYPSRKSSQFAQQKNRGKTSLGKPSYNTIIACNNENGCLRLSKKTAIKTAHIQAGRPIGDLKSSGLHTPSMLHLCTILDRSRVKFLKVIVCDKKRGQVSKSPLRWYSTLTERMEKKEILLAEYLL